MHITDFISDKMNSDDSKLLEELYSSEYQNLINYAGYFLLPDTEITRQKAAGLLIGRPRKPA